MDEFLKRTWAQINLDNIIHNLKTIETTLHNNSRVMAVVKADAYGHGDSYVALSLEKHGVKWFGVSNIEEAISLRTSGIKGDILIFGSTPSSLCTTIHKYNITQTVCSEEYAKSLNKQAIENNIKIKCHLKLDTGMGRIGFLGQEIIKNPSPIISTLSLPNLEFGGVFTHFPSADENTEESKEYTRRQFYIFSKVCDIIKENGFEPGLKHCCNSAGLLSFPEMHLDLVRPGIILYGLSPSQELKGQIDIKPAMDLFSTISMIKTISSGHSISYGRTYKTNKTTKIATVPIGYADGYPRILSGKSTMIVNGSTAPVIGRICMDSTMIDITNIDAAEGDVVTVFGGSNGTYLSTETVAELAGTICYELVCILGKRVSRVYIEGGKQIAATKYNGVKY